MLANAGAIATLLLGALGLFFPAKAAAFVSISPLGPNGQSEIRATYGGLFVSLGIFCLLAQNSLVFCVAGAAWLGALLGRVFSVFMDSNRHIKNIGGCLLEALIGALLMSPAFWGTLFQATADR